MAVETLLSKDDLWLFNTGNQYQAYKTMGAHVLGDRGVHFAVWAPNATGVSVIGDFNDWQRDAFWLHRLAESGVHVGIVPEARPGHRYKYAIHTPGGEVLEKADPYAFAFENPPHQCAASVVVADDHYVWQDQEWMQNRGEHQSLGKALSIYEVHAGSWRFKEQDGRWVCLTYRELADMLIPYVLEMGFTHIELLPVMEHSYGGSWGYQGMGFFAVSSRWGRPDDLKYLIDKAHQNHIGVFLDWAPAHFAKDPAGLHTFDGTELYSHEDRRQGEHAAWDTRLFNFDRSEVLSFLLSSAFFWADQFHADGLRIDAVETMIDLSFEKKPGEWIPNKYGGKENLPAIAFLQRMNTLLHKHFPGILTTAENSDHYHNTTTPVGKFNEGREGLGFDLKWGFGWMDNTLRYMKVDPLERKSYHNLLTFNPIDLGRERYMLPFSHDLVVHGKSPLVYKMNGAGEWQKFAGLRLVLGYMFSYPGKKLLFMGDEFADTAEWDYERSLNWHLLQFPPHQGMQTLVKDLNHLYRRERPLYEFEFGHEGFKWIDVNDWANSTIAYERWSSDSDLIIVAANFSPFARVSYRIGVEEFRYFREIMNTDAPQYGGSGITLPKDLHSDKVPLHGRPYSLKFTLPPLAAVMLKRA